VIICIVRATPPTGVGEANVPGYTKPLFPARETLAANVVWGCLVRLTP
jgi:hypothetical protein